MKLLILIAYFIVLNGIGFCLSAEGNRYVLFLEDVLLDHSLLPLLTELLIFLLLFLSVAAGQFGWRFRSQQHGPVSVMLL